MDMPDVGIGISYGALGLITGLAATYIRARLAAAKRPVAVEPDPLRVEVLKAYATKEELRELDERFERRLIAGLTAIREDILGLRRDIKENDEKAEARSSATHRRIDAIKDLCAARGGCR